MALDVGGRRIGVAMANAIALIAHPLATIENTDDIYAVIQKLIDSEDVAMLVVGLPRGLEGQHTDQTRAVEAFVDALKKHISIPIHWQDEALTSQKAEAELQARGVAYKKGEVDALAATYILDDFLGDHPEVRT